MFISAMLLVLNISIPHTARLYWQDVVKINRKFWWLSIYTDNL